MKHPELDFEGDDDTLPRPSLDDVLAALKTDTVPGPTLLYGLSDLDDAALATIREVWGKLDASQRRIIMQMLVDVSETNYELDYDAIGFLGLSDADEGVRQAAIEVLTENETITLMNRLIRMAEQDKSLLVRAEATRALGRFVLLGELGDLSEADFARVQKNVLQLLNDNQQPPEIQRRALEAIANCSHEIVTPAITAAYNSGDDLLKLSAVIAMGHSADERWEAAILQELDSDDTDMSKEAARAAGELQLVESVPHLIRMLQTADRDGQEIAIGALGEIGSKEAIRALTAARERAEEAEDDDMENLIEDALGNAALVGGNWLMMDIEADN